VIETAQKLAGLLHPTQFTENMDRNTTIETMRLRVFKLWHRSLITHPILSYAMRLDLVKGIAFSLRPDIDVSIISRGNAVAVNRYYHLPFEKSRPNKESLWMFNFRRSHNLTFLLSKKA